VLVERLETALLEEADDTDESPGTDADATSAVSMPMRPKANSSVILVLGEGLQHIPWEAMPVFQQASVSRMPSLPLVFAHAQLRAHPIPKQQQKRKSPIRNIGRDGVRLGNGR
jgi:hypothetical protein